MKWSRTHNGWVEKKRSYEPEREATFDVAVDKASDLIRLHPDPDYISPTEVRTKSVSNASNTAHLFVRGKIDVNGPTQNNPFAYEVVVVTGDSEEICASMYPYEADVIGYSKSIADRNAEDAGVIKVMDALQEALNTPDAVKTPLAA